MPTQPTSDAVSHPHPLNQSEREAVLEELNRILAQPGFNGSKRCVALFRHLVNASLAGESNEFKERTLGIEVFGRSSDYDCQADPIVRMTANEIRKRLAQCYYEQPASQGSVTIGLARGTYVPQFDFHGSAPVDFHEAKAPTEFPERALVSYPEVEHTTKSPRVNILGSRRIWLIAAAAAVIAIAGVAGFDRFVLVRPQEIFWAPLLRFDQPLTVCVADDPTLVVSNADGQAMGLNDSNAVPQVSAQTSPATPFIELTAANQITNWFAARHKSTFIQRASTATLHGFRQGPAVLIGNFDNPWPLLLTSNLRYRLRMDPTTRDEWIEDSQNPSKRDWKLSPGLHFDDSYADYVLISRFRSNETQNWIVALGSLGPHGPRAASELITDSSLSKSLPRGIGSDTNVQIVLKTWVIKGNSSAPQVVAVYTW